MSNFPSPFGMQREQSMWSTQAGNPALTRFFNAVYAWMCVGLGVSALVAYSTARYLDWRMVQHWLILIVIVELALVLGIRSAVMHMGAAVGLAMFLLFAAVNGLMLSSIFLIYPNSTLASAFIISAGTFGVTSMYGMVTKRDLSGIGRIAFMALIGLIIASVVSIFWHNSALQVLINYVGVLIFVALTAFDTQKLKMFALQAGGDANLATRMSVIGSLMLYLDFINLFLFILQIMGNSNRR